MKKIIVLVIFAIALFNCKNETKSQKESKSQEGYTQIISEQYELYIPKGVVKAALFLFGGFAQKAEDARREFDLIAEATASDIALVLWNSNKQLWLEEQEKAQLADSLRDIIQMNNLAKANIYMGGFSSGGNVSLLLCDYLVANDQYDIRPKGVFIVDSPIDLVALYRSSVKNIERNYSDVAVQESKWLINYLGSHIGSPDKDMERYKQKSIYIDEIQSISHLSHLNDTRIRLYTEPDTTWWRENRMADYDQMNAYYIERLYKTLRANKYPYVDYIPSHNRGYRANGQQHPHSWSIVDKADLIDWVLEK